MSTHLPIAALDFTTLRTIARKGNVPCPLCSGLHSAQKAKRRVFGAKRLADDVVIFHCFRCGQKGTVFASDRQRVLTHAERTALERERELQRIRETEELQHKKHLARNLWNDSILIEGTLAEKYLVEHRGLDIRGLDLSHALRWSPEKRALIGKMTDRASGSFSGVHRTFVTREGRKIDRRMWGQKGVIRVSPDEDVTHALGICEGLEDALALMLSGCAPVWACCDKSGIKNFPILSEVNRLTIFSDRGAGEAKAEACAQRWRQAGRKALVVLPPKGGAK